MAPTPIEVEAYDIDHETSDQVTTKPRRSTRTCTTSEWYGNPILEVVLLDNNEPTSYGEAMVGPDSDKWLKAIKSHGEAILSAETNGQPDAHAAMNARNGWTG